MERKIAVLFLISLLSAGLLLTTSPQKEPLPGSSPLPKALPQKTTLAAKEVVPPPCSCTDEVTSYTLEKTSTGPQVTNLQAWLQELGFSPGAQDGNFGPRTQKAVAAFQLAHHLLPTGVVDQNTWQALESLPAQTKKEQIPPPKGEVSLLIDLERRKLTVITGGKPYHEFLVAIGKSQTPSPVGDWAITDKRSWGGGFGTRWLGLNVPWGKFGIHGTNKPGSIGSAASHGCFRMWNRDVEVLSSWVKVGTRVKVIYGRFDPLGPSRRKLHKDVRGSDVYILQRRLRQLGLLESDCDGIYGGDTTRAVSAFQKQQGLPVSGEVNQATYTALGFTLFE